MAARGVPPFLRSGPTGGHPAAWRVVGVVWLWLAFAWVGPGPVLAQDDESEAPAATRSSPIFSPQWKATADPRTQEIQQLLSEGLAKMNGEGYEGAERAFRRVLEVFAGSPDVPVGEVAAVRRSLAWACFRQDKRDEALAILEQTLALVRQQGKGGAGAVAVVEAPVLLQLGGFEIEMGRATAGVGHLRQGFALLEADPIDHLEALLDEYDTLARRLELAGLAGAAEELLAKRAALCEQVPGLVGPELGSSHFRLGLVRLGRGGWSGATAAFRRAVAAWEKRLPPYHADLFRARWGLAESLWRQMRHEELASAAASVTALAPRVLGEADPAYPALCAEAARWWLETGNPSAAEPLLETVARLDPAGGTGVWAAIRLARLHQDRGDGNRARQVLAGTLTRLGGDAVTGESGLRLARELARLSDLDGETASQAAALGELTRGWTAAGPASSPAATPVLEALGGSLLRLGQATEARRVFLLAASGPAPLVAGAALADLDLGSGLPAGLAAAAERYDRAVARIDGEPPATAVALAAALSGREGPTRRWVAEAVFRVPAALGAAGSPAASRAAAGSLRVLEWARQGGLRLRFPQPLGLGSHGPPEEDWHQAAVVAGLVEVGEAGDRWAWAEEGLTAATGGGPAAGPGTASSRGGPGHSPPPAAGGGGAAETGGSSSPGGPGSLPATAGGGEGSVPAGAGFATAGAPPSPGGAVRFPAEWGIRYPLFLDGAALRPVPVDELRRGLADGEGLLTWWVGEDRLFGWYLDRDRVTCAAVPVGSAALGRLVAGFQAALAGREAAPVFQARALALYRVVLEPFLPAARPPRSLALVPADSFAGLPWEALVTAEGPGGFPEMSYLYKKYKLDIWPTAGCLAACRREPPVPAVTTATTTAATATGPATGAATAAAGFPLFLIGAPDYVPPPYARATSRPNPGATPTIALLPAGEILPGAASEADLLAGLFPPGSDPASHTWRGRASTESAMAAADAAGALAASRFLHFGLIGLSGRSSLGGQTGGAGAPGLSGPAGRPGKAWEAWEAWEAGNGPAAGLLCSLYGDSGRDGLLTVPDLARLRLRADLVTVSGMLAPGGPASANSCLPPTPSGAAAVPPSPPGPVLCSPMAGRADLARALLLAGSPRVLLARGILPAGPRLAFLAAFYRRLAAAGRRPPWADLLAQARQDTITAGFTHPADWSGFEPWGHWNPDP
ncbi:MAG: CHAT domain-containing protein [Candidatus Riflebacteria bacterium]|nr:CHAT domain-containing protein [Candidatus Riflebacteria bacterium]